MLPEKRYDIASGAVFVFGSNEAGIHGAGAALLARQSLSAMLRVGEGPMPNSYQPRCYAIPTKNSKLETLTISKIKRYVDRFLDYAEKNPTIKFFVTRLGCGLAGYTDTDIAPLFINAPGNCELPHGWEKGGICHVIQK